MMRSTAVILAQAGIQTEFSDLRRAGVDSRLHGNDGVRVERVG